MKRSDLIRWVCALVIAATLPLSSTASPLEQSFKNPPASAQAWCFWWWLNGLASKEGITRDFEEMKKQGISGALLFDAESGGPGVPHGPVFMGPEWRELFKFAVSEADRLGITLTANMCRTWNAGGPWVTPEHGIKQIVQTCGSLSDIGLGNAEIKQVGAASANDFIIRAEQMGEGTEVASIMEEEFTKDFPDNSYDIRSAVEIGPKIGGELRRAAIVAVFISLLGILI